MYKDFIIARRCLNELPYLHIRIIPSTALKCFILDNGVKQVTNYKSIKLVRNIKQIDILQFTKFRKPKYMSKPSKFLSHTQVGAISIR